MPNYLIPRGVLWAPSPKRSGNHKLIQRGLWFKSPPKRALSKTLFKRGFLTQSRFSGKGFIAGTKGGVGIVTVNGKPARRKILLLDQATMIWARSTWSAQDGSYRFEHLDETREFLILAVDNYNSFYRPVSWDKIKPKIASET
ncbi:hypothetical protein MIS45_11235 [Wielerella bovis]|uniref:hypothetical protein n=1 Tax=Wielerella bovis TaxID=2917790 RepID=UPI00201980F0|nr:hypothetical protein [Wielerella bovis]ULJ69293.1 hypothetical protein MIS45_11235 [Wielerella bovis]